MDPMDPVHGPIISAWQTWLGQVCGCGHASSQHEESAWNCRWDGCYCTEFIKRDVVDAGQQA